MTIQEKIKTQPLHIRTVITVIATLFKRVNLSPADGILVCDLIKEYVEAQVN